MMTLQEAEELLLNKEDNIEKAVALVGETRQWSDGLYRKVSPGKWNKITDGKEKSVASSGIVKKIKEEILKLTSDFEKIKNDFEKGLESKYPKGSISYKVFFDNAWESEYKKNDFLQKIKSEQSDLESEISEINKKLLEDKKKRREEKVGKKELNESDISIFVKKLNSFFVLVNNNIPKMTAASNVLPKITENTYYFDTKTTFKSILKKDEDWRQIDDKWNDMRKSEKYQFHRSPKSSSEYLIDKKTGDIYRYSDHWGRVASCTWDIKSENENTWDIAKSNLKKFVRKEDVDYFNPQFRIKMVEASETVLPKIKKLISENEKYYLTKKAQVQVNNFVDEIWKNLQYSAHLSLEEVSKLKKKYDFV